jgi:enoyl-CoA hydratase/carnithine racemase
MPKDEALLLIDRPRPEVVVLTLNQPARLNALSFTLVDELHGALDAVAIDNSARVVILTGSGRGFCSGLDLTDFGGSSASKGTSGPRASMLSQARIAALPTKIHRLPQPVIGAINGPAIGGGFALALACDLRVASPTAVFRSQFIRMGVSGCDIGVSYLLPRLVGAGRAAELLLTSKDVGAEEAERIGMVSALADDVVEAALGLAVTLTSFGSFALPMTKEVLWTNLDAPCIEAAIHLENRTQALAGTTGEIQEAVARFQTTRAATHGTGS